MNLPNKLTIFRMLLIPVFIACFYLPTNEYWFYAATAVFVIAYITDIFDGRYARKHGMVTDFGKLMDPIADKLLTASALVMLTAFGLMSPIPAIIIISREFVVSGLRLVAAGRGYVIAASKLGKTKTLSQCIAIILILLRRPLFDIIGVGANVVVQVVLWVSVALTVLSAFEMFFKNRPCFKMDDEDM